MKTITSAAEMQSLADGLRRSGTEIGFVPTMGFLHEGHLSLMREARKRNGAVVVSIFVNPTQFGPQEDLATYPRDEAGDRAKCQSLGVDYLLLPSVEEMYPDGPSVFVQVEGITGRLEGAVRPGHFRGVATVVAKLFNIVKPHRAYFGQKDYQQCAVIKRMTKGLNLDVEVIVRPTVREADGLAMSSRNSYLQADQRRQATVLHRALKAGEDLIRTGVREPEKVRQKMRAVLLTVDGITIDYAEVADAETLAPLDTLGREIVLLIAARIGNTRLIDNIVVDQ